MGAGVSKDGRDLLDAARRGDACAVESALKEAGPRIAGASTLLQRRGVLHIAARQGQPEGGWRARRARSRRWGAGSGQCRWSHSRAADCSVGARRCRRAGRRGGPPPPGDPNG